MAQGRYDWARHYLGEDLKTHPNRPESLRNLGLAWAAGYEGSLSKAVAAFRQYLAHVPGDQEIRLRLARALFRLGQSKEAQTMAQAAEDTPKSRLLLAEIVMDRDPAGGLAHILRALEGDDSEVLAHHIAAKIYFALGQYGRALSHTKRAAMADPFKKGIFYLQARIHHIMGSSENEEKALIIYELLAKLPQNGVPNRMTPFEELAILQRLAELLATENVAFRLHLCRLLKETGRQSEAEQLLDLIQGSLEQLPQHSHAFAALAMALGKTDLARKWYERISSQNPDDRMAQLKRAEMAARAGNLEEGRRLLESVLHTHPDHAPFLFSLGTIALGQNQPRRAETLLRKALHLAPWQAAYRIALADLFLTTGRRAEFDRLLREHPGRDPLLENYKKRHLGP